MDAADYASYGQVNDPTSVVASSGYTTTYPGRVAVQPRNINHYHNKSFTSKDNTIIRGDMSNLFNAALRELVLVDSKKEPFTTMIAPFFFTAELNIIKTSRQTIRTPVGIVPEGGGYHKVQLKETTQSRTQRRKGLMFSVPFSSLGSPQGMRILSDLIVTAGQNMLDSHVDEVVHEIFTCAESMQRENSANDRFPGMRGNKYMSQSNAINQLFNLRIQEFASLIKDPHTFRMQVDAVMTTITRRNGVPDVIIVGPGIKNRLALGDRTRVYYYMAGPDGAPLRFEGNGRVKEYLGLTIVDVIQPDANEYNQSRTEREIEVGEWYPMLRTNVCSNSEFDPIFRAIQISDEPNASWETLCLADMVEKSGFFDEDGVLSMAHSDQRDDYNNNNMNGRTQYHQYFSLDVKTKILPHQFDMFLYLDEETEMAEIASVWGQLHSRTTFGTGAQMTTTSMSVLSGIGVPATEIKAISSGLDVGSRLLKHIANENFSPDHWAAIQNAQNQGELAITNRNEVGQLTDANGNTRHSLNYPDPSQNSELGQGFGNGLGIYELANHAGQGAKLFTDAKKFTDAVDLLVPYLTRVFGESYALDPKTGSAAWFHDATPESTFIDQTMAALELPVWRSVPAEDANTEQAGSFSNETIAAASQTDIRVFLDNVGKDLANAQNIAVDKDVLQKLSEIAISKNAEADEALALLSDVYRKSDIAIASGVDAGLAGIDFRLTLAMQAITKEDGNLADGVRDILASILNNGDISPLSLRSIKDRKKAHTRLLQMRAVVSYVFERRGREDVQATIAQIRRNNKEIKAWWKEIQTVANANAESILNGVGRTVIFDQDNVTQGQHRFVRTPLTASRKVTQGFAKINDSPWTVSRHNLPWDHVGTEIQQHIDDTQNTVFGVSGALSVEGGLHATPFFHNTLEQGVDTNGTKRKRVADDDTFNARDSGQDRKRAHRKRASNMMDTNIDSFFNGGRSRDTDDSYAMDIETTSIGLRVPRIVVPAKQMNKGGSNTSAVLGRGAFFRKHSSGEFEKSWDRLRGLSTIQKTIMKTLMFTPITQTSAVAMATFMDAIFGALVFRPHIRHRMTSAVVMESGPRVIYIAYSETDVQWGGDPGAKELSFYPTWQSVPFLHASQWCIALHDVAPVTSNAYVGGDSVSFFGRDEMYDINEGYAPKDIYVALVPASFKPTVHMDITGVFNIPGIDSAKVSVNTPHFPGAPLMSRMHGLHKLIAQTRKSGTVDSIANTLCFRGTYMVCQNAMRTFNKKIMGTGHWKGITGPEFRDLRNGIGTPTIAAVTA